MFRTFDSFWDFPLRETAFPTRSASFSAPSVPLDVVRYEDRLELTFDLPGVDADSIELTVDKRELTLTAERPSTETEDGHFVSRQRPHGTFTRRLFLGDQLDADRLAADYDNGVLHVTVPLAESAKPRKVTIGAGIGAPAIEAEVTDES